MTSPQFLFYKTVFAYNIQLNEDGFFSLIEYENYL